MKKLLSMVLAGIIALSGLNIFANESADEIITKTELAQLYDIGIMNDIAQSPYQGITRAEMAHIVTQTMNIKTVETPNTFTDVTNNTKYINDIGFVQSYKIMCGYGNNIFKPDSEITYYEVVKTIVTMLGYEPLALQKGGYPHGYMTVANDIDITGYHSENDIAINKENIAEMLFKALDVPLMVQTSYGETTEYQISDQTIKTRYLSIE